MMKCADKNQQKLYLRFPEHHFLGDEQRADLFLQYITFYRRNLHLFAEQYLKVRLFFYQKIILYLMGLSQSFVMVAARAVAKSFLIAIGACCLAILYPGSTILICSGTKKQARLIISEKIKRELCNLPSPLLDEIAEIKDNENIAHILFKNNSKIFVVAASEAARGYRANFVIYEEFRLISKHIIDSVISPTLVPRRPAYMNTEEYSHIDVLQEEPREAYISSAFYKSHWMWSLIQQTAKDMFAGKRSYVLGFDYSLTLYHKIKTMMQLTRDKKKFDPATWAMEYENDMLSDTEGSYFTYAELHSRQNVLRAMYPRRSGEKKSPYAVKKQNGEIRVLSCDIAMIAGRKNDNSVFSCIRMLPRAGSNDGEHVSYQWQLPYMEAMQGGVTELQALRINQLFYDFECDYLVLDVRNAGVAVLDALGKVMYDPQRDCEYPALAVFNDEEYAKRAVGSSAIECIYAFKGSSRLNTEIAVALKTALVDGKIDLLVDQETAIDSLTTTISEYVAGSAEQQIFFEQPFLDTMIFVNECIELRYEKMPDSGAIRLKEAASARKDRYVSVAMGCFFANELERDLLTVEEEFDVYNAPSCVSSLQW